MEVKEQWLSTQLPVTDEPARVLLFVFEAMERCRMSMAQLAEATGLPASYLRTVLQCRYTFGDDEVAAVAKVLNIRPGEVKMQGAVPYTDLRAVLGE